MLGLNNIFRKVPLHAREQVVAEEKAAKQEEWLRYVDAWQHEQTLAELKAKAEKQEEQLMQQEQRLAVLDAMASSRQEQIDFLDAKLEERRRQYICDNGDKKREMRRISEAILALEQQMPEIAQLALENRQTRSDLLALEQRLT